jgi:hypothetical protein
MRGVLFQEGDKAFLELLTNEVNESKFDFVFETFLNDMHQHDEDEGIAIADSQLDLLEFKLNKAIQKSKGKLTNVELSQKYSIAENFVLKHK